MHDSDASNIDRVGHRRWCLNPAMKKLGMGESGKYSAMWCFDKSRTGVEWETVSYPPAGYLPTDYFAADRAWSVSVNPAKYDRPSKEGVRVRVWPARPGSGAAGLAEAVKGEPLKLDYFNVDTQGFGNAPAVIFRPTPVQVQPGARYVVEIQGLKPRSGPDKPLVYVVEFM